MKLPETTRDALEHAIEQYVIGRNGERDRKILRRKLIDGATAETIAEEFEMSTRQIFRIIYKRETQLIGRI